MKLQHIRDRGVVIPAFRPAKVVRRCQRDGGEEASADGGRLEGMEELVESGGDRRNNGVERDHVTWVLRG